MSLAKDVLPPLLVEKVLSRLGFLEQPEPTLDGVTQLYGAWCRRVPFDNVLKLIQLSAGTGGPLPGDTAADFFQQWLTHGTGGTCWAGNGALYSLLTALGFVTSRGIGTMMGRSLNTPPNHGTVIVQLDGNHYIVDASLLHDKPLRLDDTSPTGTAHPASGVQCVKRDGRWHITWRSHVSAQEAICRIERLQATAEEFRAMYEQTRAWGQFNYALAARLIRDNTVVGGALGIKVTINVDGSFTHGPWPPGGRERFLIEKLGVSEEMVGLLPPDRETPPPPRAATVA